VIEAMAKDASNESNGLRIFSGPVAATQHVLDDIRADARAQAGATD
jgi:hypothetical protein